MEKINFTKLDELRNEVLESREEKKTCVTICGGTGCHAYGCLKIAKAFMEEVDKQNLASQIDVRTTGCHGFCERGPIVVIQPDGVFYQRVQLEDIQEILRVTRHESPRRSP